MIIETALLILGTGSGLVGLTVYRKRPAIRNILMAIGGVAAGVAFFMNESWFGLLFIALAGERIYRIYGMDIKTPDKQNKDSP